jgi:predicted enzyme related to lactoylglutathione lyase
MGPIDMAWFPWAENEKGAGGTLVKHDEFYKPSADGTLVYFSSENVNIEINKVESAGGKMLVPRTEIAPEIGYMAVFMDTEGNRVTLHSRK